jgi:hypothetical protein
VETEREREREKEKKRDTTSGRRGEVASVVKRTVEEIHLVRSNRGLSSKIK